MASVCDSYNLMYLCYVKNKMTPQEIADKYGVSHMTVYRALKKHGLIRK